MTVIQAWLESDAPPEMTVIVEGASLPHAVRLAAQHLGIGLGRTLSSAELTPGEWLWDWSGTKIRLRIIPARYDFSAQLAAAPLRVLRVPKILMYTETRVVLQNLSRTSIDELDCGAAEHGGRQAYVEILLRQAAARRRERALGLDGGAHAVSRVAGPGVAHGCVKSCHQCGKPVPYPLNVLFTQAGDRVLCSADCWDRAHAQAQAAGILGPPASASVSIGTAAWLSARLLDLEQSARIVIREGHLGPLKQAIERLDAARAEPSAPRERAPSLAEGFDAVLGGEASPVMRETFEQACSALSAAPDEEDDDDDKRPRAVRLQPK